MCRRTSANTHAHTQAPDGSKELSSSPSTQVIPSGGVAGFDIQMTSSEVQDFSEKMEYVINGHHSYLFTVNAAVRPINVEIVPSALEFDFPEDSTDTELTKSVQIVNHSDAPAPYSWTTVDGSYVVNPSSGTIPPNGSVTASVTYRASSKPTASVSLVLSVVGGDELRSPPTLLCTSTVEEPKVSFPQKKVSALA